MTKKALVVISFGTTYQKALLNSISAIEQDLCFEYPNYDFYRAFTSQIVIDKLLKRDNFKVDNLIECFNKLATKGYQEILCQPTHILKGYEYAKIVKVVNEFQDKFTKITLGHPLLSSDIDYELSAKAVMSFIPSLKNSEALFLMGHGTNHSSDLAYTKLQQAFWNLKHENVYVGTVEGNIQITDLLTNVKKHITKIYLMPFMVVNGDHAHNDLAGEDENSWLSILNKRGYHTEFVNIGLGELSEIRNIYIKHSKADINSVED